MDNENSSVQRIYKIHDLHIGKMIESELRHQRRPVAWLASRLFCDRTNAYKLLKRRNIDIEQLIRISVILNHNFLAEMSTFIDHRLHTDVE